jgi:protocatechuate 4,5-dioxygenase alpha chain
VSALALNKAINDLRLPERRQAFQQDPVAYLESYGVSQEGQRLVLARDWSGLLAAGVNIYVLTKLMAVTGTSLLEAGAAMRGQSWEEFQRFIAEQNARNQPHVLQFVAPKGEV